MTERKGPGRRPEDMVRCNGDDCPYVLKLLAKINWINGKLYVVMGLFLLAATYQTKFIEKYNDKIISEIRLASAKDGEIIKLQERAVANSESLDSIKARVLELEKENRYDTPTYNKQRKM